MWTGTVSFGLVSVPVRMYGAVSEHKLHFHYVHAPDGSRIGYQKVCKSEDRPVPDGEIVKAFEIEKGEWVYMSDEDFEAAEAEATYNDEQRAHGEPAVSWAGYLARPDFWEKTLQNWQSEFLAVGTMAVFTIYLRQRGSPESKPVGAPHNQTGSSG